MTNSSRITDEWVEGVRGILDWTALSVDSVDPGTLLKIGRTAPSGPMRGQDYLRAVDTLRKHDVRLKINTVVRRHNLSEDLTQFIIEARPERWKLLQVLPVKGQNDDKVAQAWFQTMSSAATFSGTGTWKNMGSKWCQSAMT